MDDLTVRQAGCGCAGSPIKLAGVGAHWPSMGRGSRQEAQHSLSQPVAWAQMQTSPVSTLVGKDKELDAVGCQFKTYLTSGCVCMLVMPLSRALWCDLGCCSQTVLVITATANPAFIK